jgi:hypothetical protein
MLEHYRYLTKRNEHKNSFELNLIRSVALNTTFLLVISWLTRKLFQSAWLTNDDPTMLSFADGSYT